MTVENKISRLAGFLYLVVVIAGFFSLAYVPSQITLSGDPRTAVSNIMASESLFRLGIAAFMILQVAFLLLPLVLFRLLRPVGEAMATCMVAFAVVSVPIALVSLSSRLDALSLLTDARYAAMFTPQQLQAEVLLALGVPQWATHHQALLGPVALSVRIPGLQVGLPAKDLGDSSDAWMCRLRGRSVRRAAGPGLH